MIRDGFGVEIDNVTESDWCDLIARFEDANIYQTWAYGCIRWGERNLSHVILKRHREVVGMAQLRILRPKGLNIGIVHLRWGPLCHLKGCELNPGAVRAIISAIYDEYVTRRGLYVQILPNAFRETTRATIFRASLDQFNGEPALGAEKYRTFVLTLSPSSEELRRNLDRKWRNHLTAAQRNSLEVREGDSPKEYRAFCELYGRMLQRKQFRTSVSVHDFERIQERLPASQKMNVFLCEHEGKPVAGMVCSVLGDSAIYLLGATVEEGMKLKASYLLQWQAIRSLKDKGVTSYDLGGIDPVENPGVYKFKRGLSGWDVTQLDTAVACENVLSRLAVKTADFAVRALQSPRIDVMRGWLRPRNSCNGYQPLGLVDG